MKRFELLTAEIGSTTTVISVFAKLSDARLHLIVQGQAATTVLDGDVTVGLKNAIAAAAAALGEEFSWSEMLAASSAAGGLRMTVHGLVHDMTVKAAKDAALGAGANIHWVTAGELSDDDILTIDTIRPNIILLAGGVDYGEKNTAIVNARQLAKLNHRIPVIFAGNIAARQTVCYILEEQGFSVRCVDNVYPSIDKLYVEPTRRAIQEVFEKHIVEAPGMQKIRRLVGGRIVPTPGAVMRAAQLLQEAIGDLMVIDVGGATTDVHSVAEGDPETEAMLVAPEPFAKRTVEGDLGVYKNAVNLLRLCNVAEMGKAFGCSEDRLMEFCVPIPQSDQEKNFASFLADAAVTAAVRRHAGSVEYLYGPGGRTPVVRGKDLTNVRWIIGTGGALAKLPTGRDILAKVNAERNSTRLLPRHGEILIDKSYVMAAAGLLAEAYPEDARCVLCESLEFPV